VAQVELLDPTALAADEDDIHVKLNPVMGTRVPRSSEQRG